MKHLKTCADLVQFLEAQRQLFEPYAPDFANDLKQTQQMFRSIETLSDSSIKLEDIALAQLPEIILKAAPKAKPKKVEKEKVPTKTSRRLPAKKETSIQRRSVIKENWTDGKLSFLKNQIEHFRKGILEETKKFDSLGKKTIENIQSETILCLKQDHSPEFQCAVELLTITEIGGLQSRYGGKLWKKHQLEEYPVKERAMQILEQKQPSKEHLLHILQLLDILPPARKVKKNLIEHLLQEISLRANTR